mmetsp:Transcript_16574/g.27931  ORF Transcript_16574/g.27931 Transcript_16574/m.27931 type:complete len:314 (-) Transcript_16574:1610-2551(-)
MKQVCALLPLPLQTLSGIRFQVLSTQLRLHVLRDRHVRVVLHRELPFPLRHRAKISRVPKHRIERHQRRDDRVVALLLAVLDDPLPPVQVPNNRALELDWTHGGHVHHRLKDDGIGVLIARAEGVDGRQFERHLTRVHRMCCAVCEHHPGPLHRVANQTPRLRRLPEPLLDGGHKPGWNVVPNEAVHELELLHGVLRKGLDVADHAPVLALAPALLLVEEIELRLLGHLLSEVHTRLADFRLDLVLALHAFRVHLQVQLPHTADDGLRRLRVEGDPEGGVLALEAAERFGEPGGHLFALGSDRERHHRVRDLD